MIDDILDMSKIDAGRMDLPDLMQTDVRSLIGTHHHGLESLIQTKGHRMTTELGDAPLLVNADEMRVRQVLFNLLSNAVKFTREGGRRCAPRPTRGGARACASRWKTRGSGSPRKNAPGCSCPSARAPAVGASARAPVWGWRSAGGWWS